MSNVANIIDLTPDEQDSLERLAALGYTPKEMAMYLGIKLETFKAEARTDGSAISYHIERGKMTIKANAAIQLITNAEKGNLTAIQQLARTQKEREYKDLLLQLEEPDKE
jgi:hypothetical protein